MLPVMPMRSTGAITPRPTCGPTLSGSPKPAHPMFGTLPPQSPPKRPPTSLPRFETVLRGDPPCLMYEFIEGGDLAGLIHTMRRRNLPPHIRALVEHSRALRAQKLNNLLWLQAQVRGQHPFDQRAQAPDQAS